ncbi:TPA: proteasome assembly chaperone family protein [Candidatus Micrarchaeota archaeon]|nr:proteasome assembly chaperone family protein [Candidatus Micrarchaeota archaeon]
MNSIEFHKTADFKLKNPIVVVGLPGTGLVGSVSASHLTETLGFSFGGYISSDQFAPLAAIHNYVPMPAARIHYSEKHNMVVILSEMTIPVASSQELADKILEFAKAVKAKYVVSLGGISMNEDENAVYVISSDAKLSQSVIGKRGIKQIKEGATTGVSGVLLAKSALEKFPVISILAEASADYLDPHAAANALGAFSLLTGVNISTVQLEKEAGELSKVIKENVLQSKVPVKKISNIKDEGGSMYG